MSGVLLAAVTLIYAMVNHQPVEKITVNDGVIFGTQGVSTDEITEAQTELQRKVDALEKQVKAAPTTAPATTADFSGYWVGGDSWTYEIVQSGSTGAISQISPYGITLYGQGNVTGTTFSFTFQSVNGVAGTASLQYMAPNHLEGWMQTYAGTQPIVMNR
ncbi:hypothetical protein [Raineyella antarctica]|nr:hypothetical protein [Raineyella antarctica]